MKHFKRLLVGLPVIALMIIFSGGLAWLISHYEKVSFAVCLGVSICVFAYCAGKLVFEHWSQP